MSIAQLARASQASSRKVAQKDVKTKASHSINSLIQLQGKKPNAVGPKCCAHYILHIRYALIGSFENQSVVCHVLGLAISSLPSSCWVHVTESTAPVW